MLRLIGAAVVYGFALFGLVEFLDNPKIKVAFGRESERPSTAVGKANTAGGTATPSEATASASNGPSVAM